MKKGAKIIDFYTGKEIKDGQPTPQEEKETLERIKQKTRERQGLDRLLRDLENDNLEDQ